MITKNRKTIPHIAVTELAKKIQNKAPKKFTVTIGYVIQTLKVRIKMNESGSYKNNFSELTLQQNTVKLALKKIKPEKILTLEINQIKPFIILAVLRRSV